MNLVDRLRNLTPTRQFLLQRGFYELAIIIFDTFYMTFIFKESGDVNEVLNNIMYTFFAIFAGFVLGAFALKRVKVEKLLKTGFALYVVTGILGISMVQLGITAFWLISLVRGLAEGVYWVAANIIEMVGLPHDSRSRFFSVSHAVTVILNMLLPLVLGVLLGFFNSYLPVYVLFTIVCLVAMVMPINFQLQQTFSFSFARLRSLWQATKLFSYGVSKMVISAGWMLDWLLYSIIPFITLGSFIAMGVLQTVVSLASAAASLLTNQWTIRRKAKVTWPLLLINSLADTYFIISFSGFALYVNSLILNLTESVVTPVENDLTVRMSNALVEKEKQGIELVVVQELFYTSGRVLTWGVVSCLLLLGIPTIGLLKVLIALIVIIKLLNYRLSVRFLQNSL